MSKKTIKENWRIIFEAFGLVAVIASLLLVAFEIRQNNELMGAQDRYNRLTALTSNLESIFSNTNLAEVITKDPNQITESEEVALRMYHLQTNYIREWTFLELPAEELPIELWRFSFQNSERRNSWQETKNQFDREFVKFVEEQIIGQ